MIVTRFTFFNEIFCDLQLSSHQNFPLWARLHQHVFCKMPSLFSSSSRYRNLDPSESACRHNAYPNTVPLLLAAPWVIHEKNWKCLDIHAQGFSLALNSCSQSGKSCNRSLCASSSPFFVFSFCGFMQWFPVALHSYFNFFRVLVFRCIG